MATTYTSSPTVWLEGTDLMRAHFQSPAHFHFYVLNLLRQVQKGFPPATKDTVFTSFMYDVGLFSDFALQSGFELPTLRRWRESINPTGLYHTHTGTSFLFPLTDAHSRVNRPFGLLAHCAHETYCLQQIVGFQHQVPRKARSPPAYDRERVAFRRIEAFLNPNPNTIL